MWRQLLILVTCCCGNLVSGQQPPAFNDTFYSIDLPTFGEPSENSIVNCSDPDGGVVTYNLSDTSGILTIDQNTGVLRRVSNASNVGASFYTISCIDGDNLHASVTLAINFYVPNLNPPNFTMATYSFSITENNRPGSLVGMVSAIDLDGDNVIYELDGPGESFFRIFNGQIASTISFDREMQDAYTLNVLAYDDVRRLQDRMTSTATINVQINDVNDNRPEFVGPSPLPPVIINQNLMTGEFVTTVSCTDMDTGINAQLSYTLSSNGEGRFAISRNTGNITFVSGTLLQGSSFLLVVACTDGLYDAAQFLNITVEEENQNDPVLNHNTTLTVNIEETVPLEYVVADINATDNDAGEPGRIIYQLDNDYGRFSIHESTGVITVSTSLDYETQTSYLLMISVSNPQLLGSNIIRSINAFVAVNVININDNSPQFITSYMVDVNETFINDETQLYNIPPPTNFLTVSCTDNDAGVTNITYSLGTIQNSSFAIDPMLGNISAIKDLDFEETSSFSLQVYCYDNGLLRNLTNTTLVEISVLPINEHSPSISARGIHLTIDETTPHGTIILSFDTELPGLLNYTATDEDSGSDGVIFYFIGDDSEPGLFNVDQNNGVYRLIRSLDADNALTRVPFASLTVVACDQLSVGENCGTTTVRIRVLPINEHAPEFSERTYTFLISETTTPSMTLSVFNVTCTDQDAERHGRTTINIRSGGNDKFSIDERGLFYLVEGLDYETNINYGYELLCTDQEFTSTATVNITVLPENDNKPRFIGGPFNFNVSVSTPVLSRIGQVTAIDDDRGNGGQLQFTLERNTYFNIDTNTGHISLLTRLAGSQSMFFLLQVNVTDGQTLLMTNVSITLTDGNYIYPQFVSPTFINEVVELQAIGHVIETLTCNDNETGVNGRITYRISEGNTEGLFNIGSDNGILTVADNLVLPENEKTVDHRLTIECRDGGVPILSDTTSLIVRVIQNDSPPNATDVVAFVLENAAINHEVAQINATDLDNNQLMFNIIDDGNNNMRFLVADDGRIIVRNLLDREVTPEYRFVVEVSDGSSRDPVNVNVSIFVRDVNDNDPRCSFVSRILRIEEQTATNSVLTSLNCSDIDSADNARLSYTLESSTFNISSTGQLVLINSLNASQQSTYTLTINVSDNGVNSRRSILITIVVLVSVNNTRPPQFQSFSGFIEINETTPQLDTIHTVRAIDPEGNQVSYSFAGGNTDTFLIIPNSGDIILLSSLDFHSTSTYMLTVIASDGELENAMNLTISVIDVNEYSPSCSQQLYFIDIDENTPISSTRDTMLSCTDNDRGANGEVTYSILANSVFNISSQGSLVIISSVDYETEQQYELTVTVSDGGMPPRTTSIVLRVSINPINEYPPEFNQTIYQISILENLTIGNNVLQVFASDMDLSTHRDGQISYTISSSGELPFSINSNGVIRLFDTLDRESDQNSTFRFVVFAFDQGNPERSGSATVVITVEDINDNRPSFARGLYTSSIPASFMPGEVALPSLNCTDRDSGMNREISYSLVNSNFTQFAIDGSSGVIRVQDPLPQSSQVFSFDVICTDMGSPPLSSTVQVSILVTSDGNLTFSPSRYTVDILENATFTGTIVNVSASSPAGAVVYSLLNHRNVFSIDGISGAITLTSPLDYEMTQVYVINVQASVTGLPSQFADTIVEVNVVNINDEVPLFTQRMLSAEIMEGSTNFSRPVVLSCTDGDMGIFGELQYIVDNENFARDSDGNLQVLNPLDFETSEVLILTATCSDGGAPPKNDSITIVITVLPVNEYPPEFAITRASVSVNENTGIARVIYTASARDRDAQPDPISYSIISGNESYFSIDRRTGIVTVINELDYEQISMNNVIVITIQASDDDPSTTLSPNSTLTLTITVQDINDNEPSFTESVYFTVREFPISQGAPILSVTCADADSGNNGAVTYSINPPNQSFQISGQGTITSIEDLNSLSPITYSLTVQCSDQGMPALTDTSRVLISGTIMRVGPVFNQSGYQFYLPENVSIGYVIGRVFATNFDPQNQEPIRYSKSGNGTNFIVSENTGNITLFTRLDYEQEGTEREFTIIIYATDSVGLNNSVPVIIILQNVNEAFPSIDASSFAVAISENSPPGSTLSAITCQDPDDAADGLMPTLTLLSLTNTPIGFESGGSQNQVTLITSTELDYEERTQFIVMFNCTDSGGLTSMAEVRIAVEPYNDNNPEFDQDQYNTRLVENPRIGTTVFTVTASDDDLGNYNQIQYSIISGNTGSVFSIDSSTAEVRVTGLIDYEFETNYSLVIHATDVIPVGDTSGSGPLTATTQLQIEIVDLNDNRPILTPSSVITSRRESEVVPPVIIDTFQCSDVDSGMNGEVTLQVTSGGSNFYLSGNGLFFNGSVNVNITYTASVTCSDMGSPQQSSTAPVTFVIRSENQHPPVIVNGSVINITIPDNQPVGESFARILATDADGSNTPDGQILYSIMQTGNNIFIAIDAATGDLFVVSAINIRTATVYPITITVSDGGSPSLGSTATLYLTVTTRDNSAPQFTRAQYSTNVPETFESDETFYTQISCTDVDRFDSVTYFILPRESHELFNIHPTSGHLSIATGVELDYEVADTHSLLVACRDTNNATASVDVTVMVNPVNEHNPLLQSITTTVPETAHIGFLVATFSAVDADRGMDGEVRYTIAENNVFNIDQVSGRVILSTLLDYESGIISYNFSVVVNDLSETAPRTATALLQVRVEDINDNAPYFTDNDVYEQTINGNLPVNTIVLSLECSDRDIGQNEGITYHIIPDPPSTDIFDININTGNITIAGNLSERQVDNATFFVTCRDNVHPVLSDTALIAIHINEINQHRPIFTPPSYNIRIPESHPLLQPILTVTATDSDTGPFGRITFVIQPSSDIFFINSTTGTLSLLKQLDFENQQTHRLTVVAIDGTPDGLNRMSASAIVEITITNVNEYTPRCPRPIYIGTIAEMFTGRIIDFNCVDRDGDSAGMLNYTISGGNSTLFTIDGSSLNLTIPITASDAQERYSLNVTVSDMGNPSRHIIVSVEILYLFENTAAPMFSNSSYDFTVLENINIGSLIGRVSATDEDRGIQGEVVYSLVGSDSALFRIDPNNGIIYLASTLDREASQSSMFQVIASDQDPDTPRDTSAEVNVRVDDVNDNRPTCSRDFYQFQILSNLAENSPVGSITCSDADSGNNALLEYTITQPPDTFSITDDGQIMLQSRNNLNSSSSALVEVSVSDRGNPSLSILVTVSIRIVFGNTDAPVFAGQLPYRITVNENIQLLSAIFQLSATDGDSNIRDLRYGLLDDTSDTFYVNPSTGEIILVRSLDYETRQSYSITVEVRDSGSYDGSNVLSSTARVEIDITNVNDNSPMFDSGAYGTIISQSEPVSSSIINGSCRDNDDGTFGIVNVIWNGDQSPFTLTSFNNGEFMVTVSRQLTISGTHSYNITCTDHGGINSLAMVYISIRAPPDPQFSQTRYEKFIREDANIGTSIVTIMATSPNGDNPIVYSFVDDTNQFGINQMNGTVSLAQALDYESQTQFGLIIRATDSQNQFTDVLLLVRVLDVNDRLPLVPPSADLSINHSHPINAPFALLMCSDDDGSDENSRFNFTFDPPSDIFSVNDVGVVFLASMLDLTPVYALPVVCFNVETPEVRSFGVVTINVIFNNLYQPLFEFQNYHANVPENASIGDRVIQISATDNDVGLFGEFYYSIIDGDTNNHFFMNGSSGEIKVLLNLDREQNSIFNLTVAAIDGGLTASQSLRRTGTALVQIFVSDYNDNPPTFDESLYHFNITTTTARNSHIGNVICSDPDEGRNMEIIYSLHPENTYYFSVNRSGAIFLLDEHSNPAAYTLTVVCRDSGVPQLSSSAILSIIVRLEDPEAPVFNQSNIDVTINEDLVLFSLIASLSATSTDSTLEIMYNISSGNDDERFQIDEVTGELYNIRPFDAEVVDEYSITVEARYNEYLTAVSYAIVTVRVTDINDNTPYFIPSPLYSAMIQEAIGGIQQVLRVSCVDNDTITNISYSIVDGNVDQLFSINSAGVIYSTNALDYEQTSSYTLTISCSDGGAAPRSATAQVVVVVMPQNDHIPEFSSGGYNFLVAESAELGMSVGAVSASDEDSGPHGQVTYHIVTAPPFDAFFIHPISGMVHLSGTLDYETTMVYEMNATATDGYITSTVPLIVTIQDVNDNDPVISPSVVIREIEHNTSANTVVGHFDCLDADSVHSQETLTISITSGNEMSWFSLQSNGDIVWNGIEVTINSATISTVEVHCYDGDNRRSNPAHFTSVVYPVGQSLPQFLPSNIYIASVNEFSSVNTSVITVMTDSSSTVQYSIADLTSGSLPFVINSVTGEILVSSPNINYRTQQMYNFVVIANDTTNSLSNAAAVSIAINDINTIRPRFSMDSYSIFLPENLVVPAYVATFICIDEDTNDNIEISIVSGGGSFFSISSDGVLQVTSDLDFETTSSHRLLLLCSDGASDASSVVNIAVLPTNEHPPVFTNLPYMVTVAESDQTQRHIITVSASDADRVNGAEITYRLTANTASANFQINTTSGMIQNQMPLRVVDQTHYFLEVTASDGGSPNTFTSTALVTVEVSDVNEAPSLVLDTTHVIASTASVRDNILLTFECTDNDRNQNAQLQLSHRINPNPGVDLQTVSSINGILIGQLYVNASHLQRGNYTITITCIDMGTQPMSTSENISIEVIDANSEAPEFLNASYVVSVYENVTINTLLITVIATDPNGVSYQIVGGNDEENFYIIPSNGSIFIQRALDADFGSSSYNLTVTALDMAPALPFSTTTTVNVLVIGINDHDPEIIPSTSAVITSPETTRINTQIKQYTCIDIDGSTTTLSIAPAGNVNLTFEIVEDMSGNFHVALRKPLDYEFVPAYMLIIICTDEATAILPSRTSSVMLTIDVQPENIFQPEFTNASFTFSIAERSPSGTVVGVVSATDADNRAMSAIRYSIDPSSPDSGAFFIGSFSGEIRTTNNFNVNKFFYNITIIASDEDPLVPSRFNKATVIITVFDVNDNRPVCPDQIIELSINQTTFPINTSIVNITCSDEDSGINSLLIYSFEFTASNAFSIQTLNDTVGEITVSGTVTPSIYVLIVNISDRGSVPLSEIVHVVVNIQRAPDNRLQFSNPFFGVNVSENTLLSSVIFSGSNFYSRLMNIDGMLEYSTIVDSFSMFLINGATGDVTVHQSLDYESPIRVYTIVIDVEDDSNTHAYGSLSIYVTNLNDERPVFSQSNYLANVTENENSGTVVTQILATDVDFGPVTYHLLTSTNDFTINSTTGILTTSRPLDRERESSSLFLQVNATDSGNPQMFSIVDIYITIIDLNDNPPAFNETQYIVNITNVSPAGRLIALSAYDLDSSSELVYSIDDSSGLFSIDPVSGVLQLQATVPPNHREFYYFMAFVSDGIHTQNARILVQVFDVTLVLLNFEETDIIGKAEFNITAYLVTTGSDIIPDESTYVVITGNTNNTFSLLRGNVTNAKPLDRESIDSYEIILSVNGSMSNEQINVFLSIDIHDINDNAPVFGQPFYEFSITESHYVSPFEIGQIQATDQDTGINSRISFEIVNNEMLNLPFLLQSTTGGNVRLAAIGGVDREVQSLYNLTVLARDFAPINTMTSTTFVLINVIDDNDNAPIFDQSYENPITAVLDTPAGTRLSTLTATDKDAGRNGEIIFTMSATRDGFNVTSDYHLEYITNRNGIVNLITDKTIGLESDNTIFNITASDNGIDKLYGDTITLILRVGNSDPQFTSPVYTGQILQNSDAKDNEIVLQVVANDKDYGNSGQVRYDFFVGTGSTELELFSINTLTGTIHIQSDKMISAEPSTRYGFTIQAVDSAPQPGSDTAFVIIDVFGNINILNILTCQTYESLSKNITKKEQFRKSVETLIQQETGGSLFINTIYNFQNPANQQVTTVVSVYMIVQSNFYQNWTSDSYTSETAARSLPKSFYKGEDIKTFLNRTLEKQNNEELRKELCVVGLETLDNLISSEITGDEDSTTWPQSATGIAVITVAAFLLVALLFCLTCCICVCCLREEKEKDPFVHVAKRVDDTMYANYPAYGHSTVWPGYGYQMDDGEEFAHDDPESRMLYEHHGENEMMTSFINDQESEFNDENSGLHQSATDVSMVASENESTQLRWNMGPYLKEVLAKFQEGENILTKQDHKKRQKKSKH